MSLKGAYSETIHALGMADHLAAVDVTSTYPEELGDLPRVGHIRSVSAEGILAMEPDLVILDPREMVPETLAQLEATGVPLLPVVQEFSMEGTRNMVTSIADALGADPARTDSVLNGLSLSDHDLTIQEPRPSVLFIYARGAGGVTVAGRGTQMHAIIELAGGRNAMAELEGFKPLTPESLVAADPDVILLFDSGLDALQGAEGVLAMPGMAQTEAGRHGRIIAMDGHYLAGFGPRLGHAVRDLNQALQEQLYP